MKKTAWIWKESIYKNGFKCSCGNLLMKDGEPCGMIEPVPIPDTREARIAICAQCGNQVVQIAEADVSEDAKMMQGDYNEWLENQRS